MMVASPGNGGMGLQAAGYHDLEGIEEVAGAHAQGGGAGNQCRLGQDFSCNGKYKNYLRTTENCTWRCTVICAEKASHEFRAINACARAHGPCNEQ